MDQEVGPFLPDPASTEQDRWVQGTEIVLPFICPRIGRLVEALGSHTVVDDYGLGSGTSYIQAISSLVAWETAMIRSAQYVPARSCQRTRSG